MRCCMLHVRYGRPRQAPYVSCPVRACRLLVLSLYRLCLPVRSSTRTRCCHGRFDEEMLLAEKIYHESRTTLYPLMILQLV